MSYPNRPYNSPPARRLIRPQIGRIVDDVLPLRDARACHHSDDGLDLAEVDDLVWHPGWMKMKTPAELSIDFSRFSPYSWCTSPYRMKSMTSKPTWICTNATAPGGTVATFIESSWAPTFLAAILVL